MADLIELWKKVTACPDAVFEPKTEEEFKNTFNNMFLCITETWKKAGPKLNGELASKYVNKTAPDLVMSEVQILESMMRMFTSTIVLIFEDVGYSSKEGHEIQQAGEKAMERFESAINTVVNENPGGNCCGSGESCQSSTSVPGGAGEGGQETGPKGS